MTTPNVQFWKDQPDYSLRAAAWLCCDLNPEDIKPPFEVREMETRLLREAEVTGGVQTVLRHNKWLRQTYEKEVSEPRRITREALLDWALEQDVKPLFLFLDQQEPPKVKKDNSPTVQQQREDALQDFLRKNYPGADLQALPVGKEALWGGLVEAYPELFEIKYKTTFKTFWRKQKICELVNF